MDTIKTFFEGNFAFNTISFLTGIIGILLAFIFYYKSLKEKKPTYDIRTFRLIDKQLSSNQKIEIKYNNRKVENLFVSKLAIWNEGKESIKKSDFASNDHLRVDTLNNSLIYDFETSYLQEKNLVSFELSEKSIKISFEFLNQFDGFALNVYHSGEIDIKGTFIDSNVLAKPIKREFLAEKIDNIVVPVGEFVLSLFIPVRILLLPVLLLFMLFALPFAILASIMDLIRYKLMKKTPAVFSLNE